MNRRGSIRKRWLAAAGLLAIFAFCWVFTGVSPALLLRRGSHFTDIVSQMFPPDWRYIPRVLPLLWDTIRMSVTGTAVGAFFAAVRPVSPRPPVGQAPCPGRGSGAALVSRADFGPVCNLSLWPEQLFRRGSYLRLYLFHYDAADL